jgi:hypothetical protein
MKSVIKMNLTVLTKDGFLELENNVKRGNSEKHTTRRTHSHILVNGPTKFRRVPVF